MSTINNDLTNRISAPQIKPNAKPQGSRTSDAAEQPEVRENRFDKGFDKDFSKTGKDFNAAEKLTETVSQIKKSPDGAYSSHKATESLLDVLA